MDRSTWLWLATAMGWLYRSQILELGFQRPIYHEYSISFTELIKAETEPPVAQGSDSRSSNDWSKRTVVKFPQRAIRVKGRHSVSSSLPAGSDRNRRHNATSIDLSKRKLSINFWWSLLYPNNKQCRINNQKYEKRTRTDKKGFQECRLLSSVCSSLLRPQLPPQPTSVPRNFFWATTMKPTIAVPLPYSVAPCLTKSPQPAPFRSLNWKACDSISQEPWLKFSSKKAIP